MKRMFALLLAALLLLTAGCSQPQPQPTVRVIVENRQTKELEYWNLGGKAKETAAFEADLPPVCNVDHMGLDTRAEGRVKYIHMGMDGQPVENETYEAIVRTACGQIDHDIWEFQILEDGGRYFAFIKLNVNWWTPCDLYEYDPETDTLTELKEWDDVNLVGLEVLEPKEP